MNYIPNSAVPKRIYLNFFFHELFLQYRILIQQGKSKVKAQDKDGFSPIHRCCQEPPMPRYFIKGYCKQNRSKIGNFNLFTYVLFSVTHSLYGKDGVKGTFFCLVRTTDLAPVESQYPLIYYLGVNIVLTSNEDPQTYK